MVKNTLCSYRKFSVSQLLQPSPQCWGSWFLRGHTWQSLACVCPNALGEKAKVTALILLPLASPGAEKCVEWQKHSAQMTYTKTPWTPHSFSAFTTASRQNVRGCIEFWRAVNTSVNFPAIIVPRDNSVKWSLVNSRISLLDLRFWRPEACSSPGKLSLLKDGSKTWAVKDTAAISYQVGISPGKSLAQQSWGCSHTQMPPQQLQPAGMLCQPHASPSIFLPGESWWDTPLSGWSWWTTVTPCDREITRVTNPVA